MASVADPPIFRLVEQDGAHLLLQAEGGEVAHLFVLEQDIIRVLILPDGGLKFPRTWAIAPGLDDTPWEGRDRFDLSAFTCPAFTLEIDADGLALTTERLRLHIVWRNLRCRWEMRADDAWLRIAEDRPTQAYDFGWWDGKPRHYLRTLPGEGYYGLGERAGPMGRAGRRFRLCNLDAMGYDAETSDPLYKHIPFYLTRTGQGGAGHGGASFGLFYDTLADCSFDFGCERDNYHGLYRGFAAEHGDLDYYVIAGPAPIRVTERFTWLTGRPARLPRWAIGYSGSTMAYTDAPDAQAQMGGFLADCARHDIPCESFHLSSGYTSIGDKRYVFHWNRDKFPDPAAFAASYAAAGVKLVANIKPCLLRDHPAFAAVAADGLLIHEPDGSPHLVQFWDEAGAYVDFTNPAGARWWKDQVRRQLLELGIAATWNDNNEYEIVSPKAMITGFGTPRPAIECKPLQSLLMLRASREAQVEHAPDLLPMLVSRAGAAGMQRYAQTWSGDNTTAWKTLRWNTRMGLGLSLSGVSNLGHDIGGFAGPPPDAELLLRWVACGVFLPRFSIHSWNDDGSANEPWMHAEAIPAVRALLGLRHRLTPYLAELLRRYAVSYAPVLRPLFLNFPDELASWAEQDAFMLGEDLLAAPAVDPGTETVEVALPAGAAWEDYWSGERFAGDQTVRLACPFDQPPILLRAGCALPLNLASAHFGRVAFERGVRVAAPADGPIEGHWVEDDGISVRAPETLWRITGRADAGAIRLVVSVEGVLSADSALTVVLPASECRPVEVEDAVIVNDSVAGAERRVVLGADHQPAP